MKDVTAEEEGVWIEKSKEPRWDDLIISLVEEDNVAIDVRKEKEGRKESKQATAPTANLKDNEATIWLLLNLAASTIYEALRTL